MQLADLDELGRIAKQFLATGDRPQARADRARDMGTELVLPAGRRRRHHTAGARERVAQARQLDAIRHYIL